MVQERLLTVLGASFPVLWLCPSDDLIVQPSFLGTTEMQLN